MLTAQTGSISIDRRPLMQIETADEVVRFLTGQVLKKIVSAEEYDVQREVL